MRILFLLLQVSVICASGLTTAEANVRVKDLVDIEGVRGNDLVGYGLVIGLDGSGDTIRNSPYTEQALSSLLERLGVNVQGEDFRPQNIAAVLVTATLPPFARKGSGIDVTVASIGDAESLEGGMLVMTPLKAGDGEIYAVAQGSVLISGFNAQGAAARVTQGVPTTGTIPEGAVIEREINFAFDDMQTIKLALRDPDFTTAARIQETINTQLSQPMAKMLDAGTVLLDVSLGEVNAPYLISMVENITVKPAQKAKIVIDQRSGTIVLGADVKVSSVAVAQGNLTIQIAETPVASQPNAFSQQGDTVVLPRTSVEVTQPENANIALISENVMLSDLVGGLNALGVTPREMIDILKSIKSAGALHADLVLQ